jgi:hypothetical protein
MDTLIWGRKIILQVEFKGRVYAFLAPKSSLATGEVTILQQGQYESWHYFNKRRKAAKALMRVYQELNNELLEAK